MLVSGGIPTRPLVAVRNLRDTQALKNSAIAGQQNNQNVGGLATVESDASLAGHIRMTWDRNKMAREKVTQRLLKCLRARRGVYSQNELQQISDRGGLNVIWVELTEEKCKAAGAWVREVVMPVGDYPASIEPSPVPDLPEPMKIAIAQKAMKKAQELMIHMGRQMAAAQQAQQQPADPNAPPGAAQAPAAVPPQQPMDREEFRAMAVEIGERMREQMEQQAKDEAEKRAKKMETKIHDRMAEGGWDEAIDKFIEEFVTYPTAVLMGPVYERANQLEWGSGFTPEVNTEPQQRWKWVPIFDVYPAQYATSCQTGDLCVRVRYTRRELSELRGLDDYRTDQIEKALLAYTNGHLEGWIWQEAERQRLEQESLYSWLSPRGVIDGVHYWGSVPGWKLMSWGVRGMEDLDPVEEYEVDAILIGPYVIRCAVNRDPLKRRPFFNASFDPVPGSFWGRSIPDLVETPQKMVNAAACSLADNMGWASGPMGWVHVDRLADGENAIEWIPGKVFQLKSDATQGVNPGIGTFTIPDNSEKLQALIEKWSIKADDSSGVPRYTYGNERVGGAADTYSGLAMLMNNAAKGLRRAIGQIDINVIRPSIYMAFINEMVFGDDDSIKADCVVVPKGATAMLIKEARNQAVLTAAQITANPIDIPIIRAKGRAAILRKVLGEALEINPEGIVPTDEQIEEQMAQDAQAQQAAAQAQMQAEQANAQAQLQGKREEIASREKIEGAKLAAERLRAREKNQPIDFEYGPEGEIRRAVPKQQPEATGIPQ